MADQYAEAYSRYFGYGKSVVRDAKLSMSSGSLEDGKPSGHTSSHFNGVNIDIRFMGSDGKVIYGDRGSRDADPERTTYIMRLFQAQNAELGAMITGNPERFGLADINPTLKSAHRHHMHFQRNYPALAQPKPARKSK